MMVNRLHQLNVLISWVYMDAIFKKRGGGLVITTQKKLYPVALKYIKNSGIWCCNISILVHFFGYTIPLLGALTDLLAHARLMVTYFPARMCKG